MRNQFDAFKSLPEDLQKEALREGELRLEAQFQAANSADQRALSWGGFLIAAATAALGGGIALLTKNSPDLPLATLALAFSASIIRAAWLAVSTVTPKSFAFPGNSPASWLPSEWACEGSDAEKSAQARAEQADHIAEAIDENGTDADRNGEQMRRSFKWALRSVLLASIALAALMIYRYTTIREPVSELRVLTEHPTRSLN